MSQSLGMPTSLTSSQLRSSAGTPPAGHREVHTASEAWLALRPDRPTSLTLHRLPAHPSSRRLKDPAAMWTTFILLKLPPCPFWLQMVINHFTATKRMCLQKGNG